MRLVGVASSGSVLCPECFLARFRTLTIGHIEQAWGGYAYVACDYRGIPRIDGDRGPWLLLGAQHLDAWEPWDAMCDKCGKTLERHSLGPYARVERIARRLRSQRRLKRGVAGRSLMPRLMPWLPFPSIHGANRPAHRPAQEDA